MAVFHLLPHQNWSPVRLKNAPQIYPNISKVNEIPAAAGPARPKPSPGPRGPGPARARLRAWPGPGPAAA